MLCGEVVVDGERVRDPRERFAADCEITMVSKRFVSRGGEKLEGVLDAWHIDVEGKVVLDAGASTGGFTDCVLQRGAALVHAADVGHNQLDYSLRTNPRVHAMERTNIMDITALDPPPHLATADLSFRSIAGAARHILSLTTENLLVALIKPQFEWRDPDEAFSGVVRSEESVKRILADVRARLRAEGCEIAREAPSPITGRRGNQEYFFLLRAADRETLSK